MKSTLLTTASASPITLKSESRGKKHKSARSEFFSLLMKNLAGDAGNEVANALTKKDTEKFKKLMNGIADKIAEVAEKKDFGHLE